MSISFGVFFVCFSVILFLTIYVYIILHYSKRLLQTNIKYVFVVIVIILLRVLLPFNFPFTYSIYIKNATKSINKIIYADIKIYTFEIQFFSLLLIVWGVGAAANIIRYVLTYLRTNQILETFIITEAQKQSLLNEFLGENDIKRIDVAILPPNHMPGIRGIIRPKLILPRIYIPPTVFKNVIKHELEHFHNKDLLLNTLIDIVKCIYWWNPLIYILKRELVLAFEISNDFIVTKNSSQSEKCQYAECLIWMAQQNLAIKNQRLAFISSDQDLKVRVKTLLYSKPLGKVLRKIIFFLNMIFIILVASMTVFIVPENVSIDDNTIKESFDINADNAYIIHSKKGYELYLNGDYITTLSERQSFMEQIPIIEKGEEK